MLVGAWPLKVPANFGPDSCIPVLGPQIIPNRNTSRATSPLVVKPSKQRSHSLSEAACNCAKDAVGTTMAGWAEVDCAEIPALADATPSAGAPFDARSSFPQPTAATPAMSQTARFD
jgi:hypothetical protein